MDFYGGSLVRADKFSIIEAALNETAQYLERYQEMMRLFFEYVRAGDIRVRIMFRAKANQRTLNDATSKDDRYFKLYYQFLKHAFGFRAPVSHTGEYYVHFMLDELPDHSEEANRFKDFLCDLPQTAGMRETGLRVRKRDIGEVKSHDHVVLQCTDIVLGAMFFRLNRLHEVREQEESELLRRKNYTKPSSRRLLQSIPILTLAFRQVRMAKSIPIGIVLMSIGYLSLNRHKKEMPDQPYISTSRRNASLRASGASLYV